MNPSTVDDSPPVPRARWWLPVTRLDAVTAAGWYTLLTLVLTWPVCGHLASRLPSDLGDPLFASWLLQWNFDHLVAFARGDAGAFTRYWNAGIFYPEPLALLYAEHLFALGVQALPVWLVSGNLLLCYNLLFLSTFVLAGLGTFLLVRELTGSARAAFVAGLFYAFSPYRFGQLGHIQILSSQWMPFVLFGLRRFFTGGRRLPLAGAAIALIAQNLSCGYYLVYFAPFVAAYALWEVTTHGLWRNGRMWAGLMVAGTAVAGACLPFLLKYRELRARGFSPRPLDELRAFSADTFAYLRGAPGAWLWETFTSYNKPEGQLFPGLVPVVLALTGLACLAVALRRRSLGAPPLSGWRLAVAAPVAVAGVAAVELARFEVFAGRRIWRIREASPWLSDIRHVFIVVALCAVILVAVSARARTASRLALSSGRAFFTVLFFLAVWLSFGPVVTSLEHGIASDALYGWLYRNVPGFDGLRVPARFAMLAMLFLAVLAGYGAAAIDRGSGAAAARGFHWKNFVLPAIAAFFLLEASTMPVPVKRVEWARRDGGRGTVAAADSRSPLRLHPADAARHHRRRVPIRQPRVGDARGLPVHQARAPDPQRLQRRVPGRLRSPGGPDRRPARDRRPGLASTTRLGRHLPHRPPMGVRRLQRPGAERLAPVARRPPNRHLQIRSPLPRSTVVVGFGCRLTVDCRYVADRRLSTATVDSPWHNCCYTAA